MRISKISCVFLSKLILFLGVCFTSTADPVHIPVTLPDKYIEAATKAHLFTLKGNAMRLNDDGSGCQYLELTDPKVRALEGFITVSATAEARVGRAFGGNCVLVLDWNGRVEIDQSLYFDASAQVLRARAKDVRVYDSNGNRTTASNIVWQWAEDYVKGSFDFGVVDLKTPIADFNQLLPQFFPGSAPPGGLPVLNVQLGSVTVTKGSVAADLFFEPPRRVQSAAGSVPAEALSAAELEQFQARLDALDGFFTYVIKKTVKDDTDDGLRDRFFEALIEARYAVNAALSGPSQRGTQDPVRVLFVEQWNQLAPLVAAAAAQYSDGPQVLNYAAFVAGADALAALDKLGPEFGVEISSDGLRRLARLMVPDDQEDPTVYSEQQDPELERDFDLGIEPQTDSQELLPFLLDFLVTPAHAAPKVDSAVLKRLNNWIPKSSEMDTYLPMVHGVLEHAVIDILQKKELSGEFVQVYRATVIAAAWQESCWRQFVNDNGKRMPLRSGQGDIGMMQVNPRIWRGFYQAHNLKWDISYNAQAGADILLHYFKSYALKKAEHKVTGKVDNLGRATYSAYNGGPRQLTRYRSKDASGHGKKVDQAFNEKFRIVRGGDELAVRSCYVGG